LVSEREFPFMHSFGDVQEGKDLAYFNSLMNVSFGINMGDFAKAYQVSSGPDWKVEIRAAENSLQK
jgi:S-adenosylmethionine hydrolase